MELADALMPTLMPDLLKTMRGRIALRAKFITGCYCFVPQRRDFGSAHASPRRSRASLPFGVGSLLDLLETRIGVADPVARFGNLLRIHWNRARNFFASRHKSALVLNWLRASDWKFPVMPKFVERVKHRLGFHDANPAAPHRIVEHPVAILPWPLMVAVRNIM